MNLLEIYKEKNKNKEWFSDHATLGKGASGRMFEYVNTNFRTQSAFITQFEKFLEIENIPRTTWKRQEQHGQEIDKQRVINMLQSKLFKKDVDGLYSRTTKGHLYGDFIKLDFTEEARWLVNYLFLLNGYYTNCKNYIINRVKEDLLSHFLIIDGVTEDLLTKSAKELLRADSFESILRSPFFYLHSFYNDSDFLINYFRATNEEKEELAAYIEENYKTQKFICCISSKYQPSGNFNKNMLMDETRVFLLTLLFVQSEDINLNNIYNLFVKNFNQHISTLNGKQVLDYLYSNKNIFDPIFSDILELDEVEISIQEDSTIRIVEIPEIKILDVPEDYIDETSETGRQRIKSIYNIRKRQARIQNNYTCALEIINNCRSLYFTAKLNGKNYLELHHLIPREFRNDFSYSIEVLANYVALCPRCHRQIHFAIDRERKHLINALYEERKNRLDLVGLKLELNELYEYYKIDA